MEWNDFLHAGANSGKIKFDSMILVGRGQKWAWPFCLWNPKIAVSYEWGYELDTDCDAIVVG